MFDSVQLHSKSTLHEVHFKNRYPFISKYEFIKEKEIVKFSNVFIRMFAFQYLYLTFALPVDIYPGISSLSI